MNEVSHECNYVRVPDSAAWRLTVRQQAHAPIDPAAVVIPVPWLAPPAGYVRRPVLAKQIEHADGKFRHETLLVFEDKPIRFWIDSKSVEIVSGRQYTYDIYDNVRKQARGIVEQFGVGGSPSPEDDVRPDHIAGG